VNILDEDIDRLQRRRLEARKIHVRQVGVEIGRSGMKDLNEVIPLLHGARRSTFFTRDHGFYRPDLRHGRYCLVYLDVARRQIADSIQQFLNHRHFTARLSVLERWFAFRRAASATGGLKIMASTLSSGDASTDLHHSSNRSPRSFSYRRFDLDLVFHPLERA